MSANTTRDACVMTGRAKIDAIAAQLRRALLAPREALHRAPKSATVHQTARDIKGRRKTPFEHLLAVSFADVEDGIPATVATEVYRQMIVAVEQHAAARARVRADVGHPLPLIQRETRAEFALNAATNELSARPDDPEAMARYLAASAQYDAEQERLDGFVRSRLTASGAVLAVSC